jgi:DNA invertase Pin-like site-specific DNA recombinase
VIVGTRQIDLSGKVGRIVASLLFGLAESESEYRQERQDSGIAVAKNLGIYRVYRPGLIGHLVQRNHRTAGTLRSAGSV